MKSNRYVLLLLLLQTYPVAAKAIYFGTTVETVPIAYGATTILRFEEAVKTISNTVDFVIRPVNDENPDYSALAIEPRVVSGAAEVAFFLANGEIARLRLSVVPKKLGIKVDPVVDIKSQKSLVESREASTPYVGRLELMAAMIRGDQVTGYEVIKQGRKIESRLESAKITLERVYSGAEFKGYIYEIENISRSVALDVDIRKLTFGRPNQAILAYSDLEHLKKAGKEPSKTRLLIVAKPTSIYRDAVLPVRVTTEPEKESAGGHDE